MFHLLDVNWLWLFGAFSLGIFAGWFTYLLATVQWDDRLAHIAFGAVAIGVILIVAEGVSARDGHRLELGVVISIVSALGCYLLATSRWNDRPLHIGIGAFAVVALLAIANVAPARYGTRLELAVLLAVVGGIGCFVGWALRDLAEFAPAAAGSQAATGSYLFPDALAGTGAGSAFMRDMTGHGGPARARTTPAPDVLTQAPAKGGYTFPKTLPFADAAVGRRPQAGPASGLHRHWTWRA